MRPAIVTEGDSLVGGDQAHSGVVAVCAAVRAERAIFYDGSGVPTRSSPYHTLCPLG